MALYFHIHPPFTLHPPSILFACCSICPSCQCQQIRFSVPPIHPKNIANTNSRSRSRISCRSERIHFYPTGITIITIITIITMAPTSSSNNPTSSSNNPTSSSNNPTPTPTPIPMPTPIPCHSVLKNPFRHCLCLCLCLPHP